MKRVLITGGAGFIGYHLARHHLGRGNEVIIADNFFRAGGKADRHFEELTRSAGAQFLPLDLTQPLPAGRLPARLDTVYHLAAINGTRLFYEIPYQVARTNLLVTLNLLEGLRACSVGSLLYASTSEVYAGTEAFGLLNVPTAEDAPVAFKQPTPVRFSYGASKFMGEFLCMQFGREVKLPVSVIRYHNIYGPRMGTEHVIPQFIDRVRRRENPFNIYGGDQTRAFCYVEDACEATRLVAETAACAGHIVHIGNPRETRIAELARQVMEQMKFEATIVERGARSDSVSRRCPDVSKLKQLTSFEAHTGLAEGLRRTVEWYLANP
jgi:UDP-glucose 4-epimerase/UDP-glucuronate decarboxylase